MNPRLLFAGKRHLRNQHRLVLLVSAHGSISVIGNQVQMWWNFVLLLASVVVDHLHGVQWQSPERIDGNTKQAGVCVDVPVGVSLAQVVVDGGVVQEGQVGHVIAHLVLWRVHLQQLVSFELN